MDPRPLGSRSRGLFLGTWSLGRSTAAGIAVDARLLGLCGRRL